MIHPTSNKLICDLIEKFSSIRILCHGFWNYAYELTDLIADNTPDYAIVSCLAAYYE